MARLIFALLPMLAVLACEDDWGGIEIGSDRVDEICRPLIAKREPTIHNLCLGFQFVDPDTGYTGTVVSSEGRIGAVPEFRWEIRWDAPTPDPTPTPKPVSVTPIPNRGVTARELSATIRAVHMAIGDRDEVAGRTTSFNNATRAIEVDVVLKESAPGHALDNLLSVATAKIAEEVGAGTLGAPIIEVDDVSVVRDGGTKHMGGEKPSTPSPQNAMPVRT